MADGWFSPVLRFLRRLTVPPGAEAATDGQLLHRFVGQRDEAAFAALVQRHGPMVLGVCRRVLRCVHDAEDAFQAAFLVLARKARSLARSELLGNWLYGVAYRTALKARAQAARRRMQDRRLPDRAAADPTPDVVWADLRPVLDEEVNRLPGKHRAAFLLCCLEGKTNAEAARILACPEGTVASRLSWARERLRSRLTRRGLTLSAGLFAAALSRQASAAVPAPLAGSTVEAALLVAAGKAVAGVVSAQAAALMEGVLRTMSATRLRIVAAVVCAVVLIGVGVGAATSGLSAQDRKAEVREPGEKPAAAPPAKADADKDDVTLETAPPVVVKTVPEAGSASVDPKLDEIKVTFSKDMLDNSWSWSSFSKDSYPKITGKPKYLADKRTCVLPVALEPGKTYAIWVNSEKFVNFKDADGKSAVPYLLVFKTRK